MGTIISQVTIKKRSSNEYFMYKPKYIAHLSIGTGFSKNWFKYKSIKKTIEPT